MKRAALVLASLAMISAFGTAAVAAPEKLRIGTPEAVGFNFYMLDAGIDLGIYRKLDLDIERRITEILRYRLTDAQRFRGLRRLYVGRRHRAGQ